MALSTFSQLKTSIGDWLNRSDLTSVIPDFITLAEAEFNRTLRTRQMIVRANAVIDAEYTQLPNDFLQMENMIILTTTPTKLEFLSDEQADDIFTRYFSATGTPRYYTIIGETLRFVPTPSGEFTVQMTYYKEVPALSDSNATNWILGNHPDLYLYGSLLQAAPYLQDDARIATWAGLYAKGMEQLAASEARSNYSGTTPRVRAKPLG